MNTPRFQRRALIGLVALASVLGIVAHWIGWRQMTRGGRSDDAIAATEVNAHRAGDAGAAPPAPNFPGRGPALTPYALIKAFPQLGFEYPVDIRVPPNDPRQKVYVLDHTGRISCFDNDPRAERKSLFLDLSAQVHRQAESGALGFVFHPDFGKAESENRGYFYVFYVLKGEKNLIDRLSRFEVPDGESAADPHSEAVLIEQDDEQMFHNGGCLHFGPDGYLYISVGDEGGSHDQFQNSQRIDRDLFSGILRIDVNCSGGSRSHPIRNQPASGWTQGYYVPDENPFANEPGALEEFWALGLRAPHRFSFDRETGAMWCGDVGQSRREEINRIERGGNYQWCYREGSQAAEGVWLATKPGNLIGHEVAPAYDYPHADGDGGVIGGYVYRGSQFPELAGKYVFGDCNSGRVWALHLAKQSPERELLALIPSDQQLTSFGEANDGELFLCVQARRPPPGNRGAILRLQRASQDVVALPRRLSETGIFRDLQTLEPMPGVREYEVNVPFWSDNAEKRRWIFVPGHGRGSPSQANRIVFRKSDYWSFPPGTVFIKHFELPLDQTVQSRRRRLETRVLVRDTQAGVYGLTYKWLPDGSDAELLDDALDEALSIDTDDGSLREQTWHYPSRENCVVCHNAMAGYVLGVRTEQLNRDVRDPSGGATRNQLRVWEEASLLNLASAKIHKLAAAHLAAFPRYAPDEDSTASLEQRARSYLAANCSYCHQDFWRLNFRFDANFAWLIDSPLRDDLGVSGARLIRPGLPEQSGLWLRMKTCEPAHRMPPLGRELADPVGTRLVEEWLRSMEKPATRIAERAKTP